MVFMDSTLNANPNIADEWQTAYDDFAAAEAQVDAVLSEMRRTNTAFTDSDLGEALQVKQQAKDRVRELMRTICGTP